ncbi:ribonuclease BN/unknown domain fusion protein [Rubripirellula amarantea]|uniref:Uncharacterized protein n=1 Tax=Rubripirellula amarantea TaxID=2527999 RepID=A0A5C5WKN8_9BACT|nr:YhjD/YihY/BrkB family envelope integrity protein [Rubripirellula amarantea]TWT50695.1 ribonuclease BN/unknown domain fusion protein [Rubripirellula amarantea]
MNRGQSFIRYSRELASLVYRQFVRHHADGMAAELAYRTIFSLVPVAVLALIVIRVVGGLEEVTTSLEDQLYSFFGVPDVPEDYSGVSDAIGDEGTRASIRRTLSDLTHKVAAIDVRSLGVLSLALLIYAAIGLTNSAEKVFNRIYDAPSHRPFHIRLAIHWSIITLGSGLLIASLSFTARILDWASKDSWIQGLTDGSSPAFLISHALSVLASFVLLFLLYSLMPNTKVSLPAAAVGASLASVLWEGAKFGFQIYVAKAVPYSAIYGSLGLIPLFLFWIYLTWLIVLLGLILTYTLQMMANGFWGNWRDDTAINRRLYGVEHDPDWMLPLMTEVMQEFDQGNTITTADLSKRLGITGRVVHAMSKRLVDADLLRKVSATEGSAEAFVLARPAAEITVNEVLKQANDSSQPFTHQAWRLLAKGNASGREATLADLFHEISNADASSHQSRDLSNQSEGQA